jgi:amidohydrolase
MIDAARIRSLIEHEVPSLTALRRELHQHPEIGYEEIRTAERIRAELDAIGVRHADGLARGTGTLAHIPGGAPGAKAVALRADIDALPMQDQGVHGWRSRIDGRAHACGHDGHTTIAIGAARVLSRLARDGALPNPVTFLFQPAEEGGNGGARMVEDGALNGSVLGPAVAQIYGLHGWPSHALGTVSSRPGPMLAAAEAFEIRVRGAGGHAAFPHLACDPVLASSAIVQNLQSVVSRNVRPLDAAVVTVASIHAGNAHNVIPESAHLLGTIRWFHASVGEMLRRRMSECVQHTAQALGASATIEFKHTTPSRATTRAPSGVSSASRASPWARTAWWSSAIRSWARRTSPSMERWCRPASLHWGSRARTIPARPCTTRPSTSGTRRSPRASRRWSNWRSRRLGSEYRSKFRGRRWYSHRAGISLAK